MFSALPGSPQLFSSPNINALFRSCRVHSTLSWVFLRFLIFSVLLNSVEAAWDLFVFFSILCFRFFHFFSELSSGLRSFVNVCTVELYVILPP